MQKTDDLIEQMSAAFRGLQKLGRPEARELARAALQAIEASGTHVVMPAELTPAMHYEGLAAGLDEIDRRGLYNHLLAARPKVTP
jgi:hypothetical protein